MASSSGGRVRWSRRPPATGKVPGTGEGLTFIWQPQPRTEVAFGATAAPSDLDEPPVPHQETVSVKKKKKRGKKNKKRPCGGEKPQGEELRCSGQASEKVSILLAT